MANIILRAGPLVHRKARCRWPLTIIWVQCCAIEDILRVALPERNQTLWRGSRRWVINLQKNDGQEKELPSPANLEGRPYPTKYQPARGRYIKFRQSSLGEPASGELCFLPANRSRSDVGAAGDVLAGSCWSNRPSIDGGRSDFSIVTVVRVVHLSRMSLTPSLQTSLF